MIGVTYQEFKPCVGPSDLDTPVPSGEFEGAALTNRGLIHLLVRLGM